MHLDPSQADDSVDSDDCDIGVDQQYIPSSPSVDGNLYLIHSDETGSHTLMVVILKFVSLGYEGKIECATHQLET